MHFGIAQVLLLTIPEGVKICAGAFKGCTGITQLTIPKGVHCEHLIAQVLRVNHS